jgi:hypothetical protein
MARHVFAEQIRISNRALKDSKNPYPTPNRTLEHNDAPSNTSGQDASEGPMKNVSDKTS